MTHRKSNYISLFGHKIPIKCIIDKFYVNVQLLQSLESDLKRYQQSVTVIGTSQDDANIREELIELRSAIKNKFATASNDISQQQQT